MQTLSRATLAIGRQPPVKEPFRGFWSWYSTAEARRRKGKRANAALLPGVCECWGQRESQRKGCSGGRRQRRGMLVLLLVDSGQDAMRRRPFGQVASLACGLDAPARGVWLSHTLCD